MAFVIAAATIWLSVDLTASGYPVVMFLNFLGSAAMVVPVPGFAALCVGSTVLNPFLLGALSGIAESLGEVSGYAVGYGGQNVLQRHRFYDRAQRWMVQRGGVVLFIVSIIPNPFFDLVGIAAGGTRYPLSRFLVIVMAGKVLKGVMIGYGCYYYRGTWWLSWLPWVN